MSDFKTAETLVRYSGSNAEIEIPNGVSIIGQGAFMGNYDIRSVIIPDGVETIGQSAFENCINLEKVYLPSSVRVIDNNAFFNCRKLLTIELPINTHSIGNYAFGNTNISELTIPSNVKHILQYTFAEMKLKSIVIPANITQIGYRAFHNCKCLEEVCILAPYVYIDTGTFDGCESLSEVRMKTSARLGGPITNQDIRIGYID